MPNLDQLSDIIEVAIQPQYAGLLKTRGAARSLIWSEGKLPEGAPEFSPRLSYNLRQHGYSLLDAGLMVLEQRGNPRQARQAFLAAAEALEAVAADGTPLPSRDFERFLAACSYHLARYAARSYSMLTRLAAENNLTPAERLISLVIQRDLRGLEVALRDILDESALSDGVIAYHEDGTPAIDLAMDKALISSIAGAVARAQLAYARGDVSLLSESLARLDIVQENALKFGCIDHWWTARLARFLLSDLWETSFHTKLPENIPEAGISLVLPNPIAVLFGDLELGLTQATDEARKAWSDKRARFIASLYYRKRSEIDLWPSQLAAVDIIFNSNDNAVVSLPTSAGKTRIAELAILMCLAAGRRVVFVTPLRALSAQTEAGLAKTFSPLGATVSSLYGSMGSATTDDDLLADRDIIVATPEKLDFALRNTPELLDGVGLVVLDEGHMIGLGEREVRYEVQIQRLLLREDANSRRILCLSAVLPDDDKLEDFVGWLSNDSEDGLITANWRATGQQFGTVSWAGDAAKLDIQVGDQTPFVPNYLTAIVPKGRRKKAFPTDQRELVIATAWRQIEEGHTVLIYHPVKRFVEPMARHILKLRTQGLLGDLPAIDATTIEVCLAIGNETLGNEHPLLECLSLGIAVHHADLPTPFRRELEKVMRSVSFPITIASPTLSQGLNLSATSLIFQGIRRGQELIEPASFRNVVGRAGRAFVDLRGLVLFPMFEPNWAKQRDWNALLNSSGDHEMESGLVRLMLALLQRLIKQSGINNAEAFKAFLLGQTEWEFSALEGEQDDTLNRARDVWESQVQMLDTALLSLLGNEDISNDELATQLDELLATSLWTRRLRHRNETMQSILKTGLVVRAQHIWRETSVTQRRAYFLAGVGLKTGQKMDTVVDDIMPKLIATNGAILVGEADVAVETLIEIAEVIFSIKPFIPTKFESWEANWRNILSDWLRGEKMATIRERYGANVTNFVDNAFVYALPWGIEAMRVRAVAHDYQVDGGLTLDDFDLSQALPCVETGTLNTSAALLMKTGFSLRSGAITAAETTEAELTSLNDVREWIRSGAVRALSADPNWPTPASRALWLNFVDSFYERRDREWNRISASVNVEWKADIPIEVGPARLLHQDKSFYITNPDFQILGRVSDRLGHLSTGITKLDIQENGQVLIDYAGPLTQILQ